MHSASPHVRPPVTRTPATSTPAPAQPWHIRGFAVGLRQFLTLDLSPFPPVVRSLGRCCRFQQRRLAARALPPHELLAASGARRGDGATNGQVAYAVGNSNGNIEENEKPAQRDAAANGNGKEEAGLQMIGIENVEPVSSFHAMFTFGVALGVPARCQSFVRLLRRWPG